MLSGRVQLIPAFVAVASISILMGAFLGGNLFTLITGEFPGPGPGYGQQLSMKVDSETLITTANPERFTSFIIPQIELWYWSITGRMTSNVDGTYNIAWSRHAGVLTTIGKNWIEDQISDSPSATPAAYISLSRNVTAPNAAWTIIPAEIDTGGGLDRTGGTYTSTGDGVWTVAKQFTADAAYVAVQLTGLQWSDTDSADNTLLCADTFASTTLAAADKITVTWTITVS
jgi:hypothetical protein